MPQKVYLNECASVCFLCFVEIFPVESTRVFAVQQLINGVAQDFGETCPVGVESFQVLVHQLKFGIAAGSVCLSGQLEGVLCVLRSELGGCPDVVVFEGEQRLSLSGALG